MIGSLIVQPESLKKREKRKKRESKKVSKKEEMDVVGFDWIIRLIVLLQQQLETTKMERKRSQKRRKKERKKEGKEEHFRLPCTAGGCPFCYQTNWAKYFSSSSNWNAYKSRRTRTTSTTTTTTTTSS